MNRRKWALSAGSVFSLVAAFAAAPTSLATAGPPDDIDRDATLVFAVAFDPPTLDKHLNPHTGVNSAYVRPVYDRLVYITPEGAPEPMLATSWEAAEDGTSIVFELRDDVVFHDLEPFNADAVVANFERARDHPESRTANIVEQLIEGAEAVDEYTVRFDLKGAYSGAMPLIMGDDLGSMASPASFERDDIDRFPVGSGPYRIVESQPGFGVTYEAFEEYYAPERQTLAQIEVRFMPDANTRLSAIEAGQVHLTHVEEPAELERAERAGLQVASRSTTSAYRVAINEAIYEPFADPQVRLAINLALDREQLSDAVFGGLCLPKQQYFGVGEMGHNPELEGIFDYDPERARELLAEAGYADGLQFRLGTWTTPIYTPIAELIQAQLAVVGIDVEITLHDSAVFGSNWRAGEFEMILGAQSPLPEPSLALFDQLATDSGDNPGGWDGGDRMRELMLAALEPVDPAERDRAYQELSAELYTGENSPPYRMELCSRYTTWVGSPDIVGLSPDIIPIFGTVDFVNLGLAPS